MPAPVSIIIPTLNAAAFLPATLASLFEGMSDGLISELIVADGGSTDLTAEIAEDVGATVITTAPGRGGQLAAGAAAARSPWLLFAHADSVLSDGWSDAVAAHMTQPGCAAVFRLAFDDRNPLARMTAGWANLRARVFALPYGDQGLLIHRDLYDQIGGFDPIPLMEDVAIARKIGRRMTMLNATLTTNADKYRRNGWIWQGSRNLLTLSRYLMGTDPAVLAATYAPPKAPLN